MTNLNSHPLAPFFQLVAEEYERGLKKYGEWEKIPEWAQQEAIWKEYNEWYQATLRKDITGEHGELAELTHLANVAGRRWTFLNGQK